MGRRQAIACILVLLELCELLKKLFLARVILAFNPSNGLVTFHGRPVLNEINPVEWSYGSGLDRTVSTFNSTQVVQMYPLARGN
jgi:hypothetical protein